MEGNHTADKIISILMHNVNHAWLLLPQWIQFSDANCFAFARVCEFGKCVTHVETKQVNNWTLIAKNPLGVKTLTDAADPTHRGKTYFKYFLNFAWSQHLNMNLIISFVCFFAQYGWEHPVKYPMLLMQERSLFSGIGMRKTMLYFRWFVKWSSVEAFTMLVSSNDILH